MYEWDAFGIYKIVDEKGSVYYEAVENVSKAVLQRRRQILSDELDIQELNGMKDLTVEEVYIAEAQLCKAMLELLIATQTALGRSLNKPVKKIIKLSEEQIKLFTAKEEKTGMSQDQKRKISKTLKGTKKSEDTRRKISAKMRGKTHPTVICPHCGKEGRGGAMTRYHFNNCKEKA